MIIKDIVRFVVCATALTTVTLVAQVNSFHITQTNPGGSWSVGVPATVTQQGALRFTNAAMHTVDVAISGRMSHSGSGGATPVNSTVTLGNLTIETNGGMAGKQGNTVIVGPGTTITVIFTSRATLTATTTGTITVTGTAEARPDGSAPAPASGSGSVPVIPPEAPHDEEEAN